MINLKSYILLITLICVLFTSSYFSFNILKTSSTLLENRILSIEKHIRENNWNMAEKIIVKTNFEWTTHEKTWSILLEHVEIDTIEFSLIKLQSFIKLKDYSSSLSESIIIQAYLKHIHENETFKLINIL